MNYSQARFDKKKAHSVTAKILISHHNF